MPKQRISPWRVLSGNVLLRRLRVNDALRFLLYTTNACRMNEPVTVTPLLDSRGLVGQDCQAQPVVIAGLSVTNFSLCLLQLRLAQFDN